MKKNTKFPLKESIVWAFGKHQNNILYFLFCLCLIYGFMLSLQVYSKGPVLPYEVYLTIFSVIIARLTLNLIHDKKNLGLISTLGLSATQVGNYISIYVLIRLPIFITAHKNILGIRGGFVPLVLTILFFVLMSRSFFASIIALDQKKNIRDSFKESFLLTRGIRWKIFWYSLLYICITIFPIYALSLLSNVVLQYTLSTLISAAFFTLYCCTTIYIYRYRKENILVNPQESTQTNTVDKKSKSIAGWIFAGLSFIPGIGVLFGAIAITIGILKKIKGILFLGIAGVLFTILIYGSIFYFGFVAKTGLFADLKIQLTSQIINTDAGQILLYKNEHGVLPTQLSDMGTLSPTNSFDSTDPWMTELQYTPLSDGKFELRSAGPDKIMNTEDDISQTF